MGAPDAVPVLMYHSVGRCIPQWSWKHLTVPHEVFADQLLWLTEYRYRTFGLDDLQRHVKGEARLPPRSIVLTFDDGYLDNWTHVAPLLARRGLRATVFVNPEFVDPRPIKRPVLADTADGSDREGRLDVRGFMSWDELRTLDAAGTLSVQSHLLSHTWYPTGSEVVDFRHPGDAHYWLDWNAFPEEKPYYLAHLERQLVPPGTPVRVHSKAMEACRFFPQGDEDRRMVEYVRGNGGLGFFQRRDWRQILVARLQDLRREAPATGKMESPEERSERLRTEILGSAIAIQDRLGRRPRFMAWPGGGYGADAIRLADEVYDATTVGSRDSRLASNAPGGSPRRFSRMGAPGFPSRRGALCPGGRYLVRALEEHAGSRLARRRRQLLKVFYLVSALLGRGS